MMVLSMDSTIKVQDHLSKSISLFHRSSAMRGSDKPEGFEKDSKWQALYRDPIEFAQAMNTSFVLAAVEQSLEEMAK